MDCDLNFENGLSIHISRITGKDKILFEEQQAKLLSEAHTDARDINYENSFEYLRMYFDLGKFRGYRYYDGDTLIFFTAYGSAKKPHFKIFKPLGKDPTETMERLRLIIKNLKKHTTNPITMVCLTNVQLSQIKQHLKVKKIKSFEYYIYDLEDIVDLKGTNWKNVRQKVNAFKKAHPKTKITTLNEQNFKSVVHFISAWRKQATGTRGFSYADIDKSKSAVQYYSDKVDLKNIWAKVYYIHGNVEAVQLLYRITTANNQPACAHAIGLANNDIAGLSENSQIDIWRTVKEYGVRYINDGPSWRTGLKKYKQKFNPCGAQNVYECSV